MTSTHTTRERECNQKIPVPDALFFMTGEASEVALGWRNGARLFAQLMARAALGRSLLDGGGDGLDAVAHVDRQAAADRPTGVERAVAHQHLRRHEIAQHRNGL